MPGRTAGLLPAGDSWLLEFELGHAPGPLGYERLEDTGVEADEAEGDGAVEDADAAATAAALNGDGLGGSGPPGPDSSSGPPGPLAPLAPLAPLTGVTLVLPMLLTPLLL